jgi:hypothetical protein
MKKQILLFTLSAGMIATVLMSNQGGAAAGAGGNRTGAKASTANCSGGGCHGAISTATTTAAIRVDSAGGVQVTKYVAGMTYTVTVTGTHTTLNSFGFQYAAVSGTGATQEQAGTFTALPASVVSHSLSSLNIIEQSSAISGPLSKSFSWTAPATGVGNVTMYLTVNAVDGSGGPNSADVGANVSKVLTQYTSTSVPVVANNVTVSAFPNPVVGQLNVQVGDITGAYTVAVYDITGRSVATTSVAAGNVAATTSFNTTNWAPGAYMVVVESEGNRTVQQVVKQ